MFRVIPAVCVCAQPAILAEVCEMAASSLGLEGISDFATGCALLGSGGGGDSYAFSVVLSSLLIGGRTVTIVDPDDLDPEALVVSVGFVGAPITLQEKLVNEIEITSAVEAMQRRLGRPISALMATEIGGGNGLSPFMAGALLGLPVVDADGMGRAFPLSDQVSYAIYGHSALPTVLTSEQGDVAIIEAGTNRAVERLARSFCVAMGSKCFSADYPLNGSDVRQCAILRTVSLARSMGAVIREARKDQNCPLTALKRVLQEQRGISLRLLFEGTIVDRENNTRAGFGVGRVHLARVGHTRPEMVVDFQNEFLIARREDVPVATTPDIISIVDAETFSTITSDSVRYGQRVKVIVIQAPPVMCTERALAVVGPRAFGIDADYRPAAIIETNSLLAP